MMPWPAKPSSVDKNAVAERHPFHDPIQVFTLTDLAEMHPPILDRHTVWGIPTRRTGE